MTEIFPVRRDLVKGKPVGQHWRFIIMQSCLDGSGVTEYTVRSDPLTIGAFVLAGIMLAVAVVASILLSRERATRIDAEGERHALLEKVLSREARSYYAGGRASRLLQQRPAARGRRARFQDPVQQAAESMKRRSAMLVAQWLLLASLWPRVADDHVRRRYFAKWSIVARVRAVGRAVAVSAVMPRGPRSSSPTNTEALYRSLPVAIAPWQLEVGRATHAVDDAVVDDTGSVARWNRAAASVAGRPAHPLDGARQPRPSPYGGRSVTYEGPAGRSAATSNPVRDPLYFDGIPSFRSTSTAGDVAT